MPNDPMSIRIDLASETKQIVGDTDASIKETLKNLKHLGKEMTKVQRLQDLPAMRRIAKKIDEQQSFLKNQEKQSAWERWRKNSEANAKATERLLAAQAKLKKLTQEPIQKPGPTRAENISAVTEKIRNLFGHANQLGTLDKIYNAATFSRLRPQSLQGAGEAIQGMAGSSIASRLLGAGGAGMLGRIGAGIAGAGMMGAAPIAIAMLAANKIREMRQEHLLGLMRTSALQGQTAGMVTDYFGKGANSTGISRQQIERVLSSQNYAGQFATAHSMGAKWRNLGRRFLGNSIEESTETTEARERFKQFALATDRARRIYGTQITYGELLNSKEVENAVQRKLDYGEDGTGGSLAKWFYRKPKYYLEQIWSGGGHLDELKQNEALSLGQRRAASQGKMREDAAYNFYQDPARRSFRSQRTRQMRGVMEYNILKFGQHNRI
jgi:hypothetical protein